MTHSIVRPLTLGSKLALLLARSYDDGLPLIVSLRSARAEAETKQPSGSLKKASFLPRTPSWCTLHGGEHSRMISYPSVTTDLSSLPQSSAIYGSFAKVPMLVHKLHFKSGTITSLVFSADGRFLLSGGEPLFVSCL